MVCIPAHRGEEATMERRPSGLRPLREHLLDGRPLGGNPGCAGPCLPPAAHAPLQASLSPDPAECVNDLHLDAARELLAGRTESIENGAGSVGFPSADAFDALSSGGPA
jgi:AraC-like DNA-binding protein